MNIEYRLNINPNNHIVIICILLNFIKSVTMSTLFVLSFGFSFNNSFRRSLPTPQVIKACPYFWELSKLGIADSYPKLSLDRQIVKNK